MQLTPALPTHTQRTTLVIFSFFSRLPSNLLFVVSIVIGAYLVARKFKKIYLVNYSVLRIFLILSFVYLGSCLLSFVYTFILIKYFRQNKGKFRRAIIAATIPGVIFPVTAILKYLAIRKTSEIIAPDRSFVLCYSLRSASIVVYRTIQSGLQDIWLFIGLSLLHGVSNVLSKATLNLRIKLWTLLVKYFNRICCGPTLVVRSQNSPRIRRFNADLEIQNILIEYNTIILSHVYLACHLVMNYDIPYWQAVKPSLIRVAIGLAIDFLFNIISVFIQIHFYDIPMQMVWKKYWRRHVAANCFIIIVCVSIFASLITLAFSDIDYASQGLKLKNCTTIF